MKIIHFFQYDQDTIVFLQFFYSCSLWWRVTHIKNKLLDLFEQPLSYFAQVNSDSTNTRAVMIFNLIVNSRRYWTISIFIIILLLWWNKTYNLLEWLLSSQKILLKSVSIPFNSEEQKMLKSFYLVSNFSFWEKSLTRRKELTVKL